MSDLALLHSSTLTDYVLSGSEAQLAAHLSLWLMFPSFDRLLAVNCACNATVRRIGTSLFGNQESEDFLTALAWFDRLLNECDDNGALEYVHYFARSSEGAIAVRPVLFVMDC
ncbi:hypothetical protein R1flu_017933 [Riccia fluitans]|uniref:Uncharacterized protein n=1 Tax=Riccia fluitans TaxID=41844 RepID=A0ABD1ZFP5_9MARC